MIIVEKVCRTFEDAGDSRRSALGYVFLPRSHACVICSTSRPYGMHDNPRNHRRRSDLTQI